MSIPLSTPVDRVHFHPSISYCIFMCIVGSENMLLLFPTSLHKSIVPCGGTGLRRYAVPSLLN